MKLLGNVEKGLLFVISAPSGTGKSTLADMLIKEFPEAVERAVTCTTRNPRGAEKEGVDYYFLSDDEYENKLVDDDFLENADVFSNRYGTLASEVDRIRSSGKHAVLVIDTQGALKVRMKTNAILIFVSPPSTQELEKRLEGRQTDTEESISERLSWSTGEMEKSAEYDYLVINDDLQVAYQTLRSIVIAEEHANH
jgi:guanylate kinase